MSCLKVRACGIDEGARYCSLEVVGSSYVTMTYWNFVGEMRGSLTYYNVVGVVSD